MPQAQTLTLLAASLSDSSTDEAYSVADRREGTTTFRHTGTGPLALAKRFKVAVKQPSANSQYYRVVISLASPVSYNDPDTQQATQLLINRGTLEFQINKNATSAQALETVERMLAVLSLSEIQQAVKGCENFY